MRCLVNFWNFAISVNFLASNWKSSKIDFSSNFIIFGKFLFSNFRKKIKIKFSRFFFDTFKNYGTMDLQNLQKLNIKFSRFFA